MTQVSLFVREHRMRKYAKANPKEREIPLPYFLLRALEARAGSGLIFHTTAGKKDGHMLRRLQTQAKRAGLNPADFGLHKFRKSYAALQHRARTIQKRLGHESLETTLA
jgi:integrase/recombinase XerD